MSDLTGNEPELSVLSSTTSFSQPLLPNLAVSDHIRRNERNEVSFDFAENNDDTDEELNTNENNCSNHRGEHSSEILRYFHTVRVLSKSFISALWNGPKHVSDPPPKPIKALYPVECLPTKLRSLLSRRNRVVLLIVYMTIWIYIWAQAMMPYYTVPPTVDGVPVKSFTCGQVGDLWKGKNAACGIDARFCPASGKDEDVIFRCPALCDRGAWLYSLRAVGDSVYKYRGFFIGGGEAQDTDDESILSRPYRADSYPCGSAVHAGIISPFYGGCARITYLSGAQASFVSSPGHYGVSDSIGFSSFFPKSFVFAKLPELLGPCKDPRLVIVVFNIFMGIPIVFFGSSAAFYWIMSIVGFWTISLATDPPIIVDPQDPETLYDLLSVSLERFLPSCFIFYVLWVISVKKTFHLESSGIIEEQDTNISEDPENTEYVRLKKRQAYSPIYRIVFWYTFFWIGVLNNVTFDRLPIDRLTTNDLQSMPGALLAIYVLGGITLVCVAAQAYYLWLLGRLWQFLKVYALVSGLLVVLALLPGLTLRIHHYIFALLLIPGCSTKGWTAHVFQGLLLGLFLSGVARWGYASIAETNFSLLRGEPMGIILAPLVENYEAGVLYWNHPDGSAYSTNLDDIDRYTEVSLLINDIERFRGVDKGKVNVTDIIQTNEHFRRLVEMAMENKPQGETDITMYLRLARYSNKQRKYGDYTQTSILKYPSLDWTPAPPGIT